MASGSLALPTGASAAGPMLTSASLSWGSYTMALISLVGRKKKTKKQAWMLTLNSKETINNDLHSEIRTQTGTLTVSSVP